MRRRDAAHLRNGIFLADLVSLSLAYVAAIHLRAALSGPLLPPRSLEEVRTLVPSLPLVLFVWILTALIQGLYRSSETFYIYNQIRRIASAAWNAVVVLVLCAFFIKPGVGQISRGFLLLFGLSTTAILGTLRFVALGLFYLLQKKGHGVDVVALVGRREHARDLIQALEKAAPRIRLAGFIGRRRAEKGALGSLAELASLINRHHLTRLILLEPSLDPKEILWCLEIAQRMHVTVNRRPRAWDLSGWELGLSTVGHLPLIEIQVPAFSKRTERLKRALDLSLVLLLSPFLLLVHFLIAAAVMLDSPGPALHRDHRVGQGGRHFVFYKYRTMVLGAHTMRTALGRGRGTKTHIYKERKDPRVTRVGSWLRRLSLDELPQFWNVAKGDMSLVGPRPLPAADLAPDGQSRDFGGWARSRSRVPPGLTGLWQVSGRSDLSFEDMVRLDMYYIRNWSLALDLKILIKTLPAVILGRGAY